MRKVALPQSLRLPVEASPSAPILQGSHVRAGRAHCPVFLTSPLYLLTAYPLCGVPGGLGSPARGAELSVRQGGGSRAQVDASGGPNLRFTLNPQNSPELAKCSIRQPSIDRAADRCAAAVGWGRRSEQTLPSVPSAWDGAEEWRRGARPLGSLRPHTAFQATPPGSGT